MNDARKWIYILLARLDRDDDFCVFNVYAKRSLAERAEEQEITNRVSEMKYNGIETTYEKEELNFQLCQFPLPKYDN